MYLNKTPCVSSFKIRVLNSLQARNSEVKILPTLSRPYMNSLCSCLPVPLVGLHMGLFMLPSALHKILVTLCLVSYQFGVHTFQPQGETIIKFASVWHLYIQNL